MHKSMEIMFYNACIWYTNRLHMLLSFGIPIWTSEFPSSVRAVIYILYNKSTVKIYCNIKLYRKRKKTIQE